MDQLMIINKALLKCGLPMAAALNDCDWNASYVFEQCRDECLRLYTWGFAQEIKSLPQQGTPPCGFEKSYALPADCMKVIDCHVTNDLRSPRARHLKMKGKQLYCNISPCYLRYVTNNVDVADWPPDFADAVSWRIAVEIAALSTQSNLAMQLMQGFELAMAKAQDNDAKENAERVPHDWNIMLTRGGAGERRGKM